jgi:3(or 17)beta-hydroxysteroid dehydrogenase
MTDRLAGKVALVTGAAQGLGAAVAQRLAQAGARVLITDRNATGGARVAAAIGGRFVLQDVSEEAGWSALATDIAAREGALHILVNNAGIEGDPDVPKDPEHAPREDWDRIFAVNSTGVFLGCKHMIPLLARSGGGSIINFSSVASMLPTPFITAYGAAKAAVAHLSRTVALHCAQAGHAIRCNSVHPGQIMTPMLEGLFSRMGAAAGMSAAEFGAQWAAKQIPLRKLQEPEDIANLVLFLASDESRYITGQAIACDGGLTLVA